MRGDLNKQSHLFSYFSPESRVPGNHPLRTIKQYADQALGRLSGKLGVMYSDTGRPSIPPERLLKAKLLIALYTVRSERLFCEMLDYNVAVTDALVPESDAALDLIRQQKRKKRPMRSLGADKGYHNKKFVKGLNDNGIKPHVACIKGRHVDGLDGRTTNSRGYQISQTVRKRIEQIMGWTKTIGGMRKTRHKGVTRTDAAMKFVCTAYNLLRLSRLRPLTPELRLA